MAVEDYPKEGRKIFFLNPSYNVDHNVVRQLRELEYEVYTVMDYHYARNILRANPGCILYICIDMVQKFSLAPVQWFNFLKACEADPDIKDVLYGIITGRKSTKNKALFSLNITLSAGYIVSNYETADDLANFMHVLDVNHAKGNRSFVRADCLDRNGVYAEFYNPQMNQKFALKIVDVCSAGFTMLVPEKFKSFFAVKNVYKPVNVYLDGEVVAVSLYLALIKPTDKGTALIMALSPGNTFSNRLRIREFISKMLHNKMDILADYTHPDETVYEKKLPDDILLVEDKDDGKETEKKSGDKEVEEIEEVVDEEDASVSEPENPENPQEAGAPENPEVEEQPSEKK